MQTQNGVYNPEFDINFLTTEQGEVLTLTMGKSMTITLPFRPIERVIMEKRKEKKSGKHRR